jgi:rod shape determining protein RodA
VGSTIFGAQAWIRLPAGFTIQPSEFAKVAIIVGVALVLADRSASDAPTWAPSYTLWPSRRRPWR